MSSGAVLYRLVPRSSLAECQQFRAGPLVAIPPMVSAPAPLEFQYMARSRMIFLPVVLRVTVMEALPVIPECSAMLKVLRKDAGIVSVFTMGVPPPAGR